MSYFGHALRRSMWAACIALLAILPRQSVAGRIEEPWDHLPDFTSISFSATAVGFRTDDPRHFVLDRGDETLREVDATEFERIFQGTLGPRAAERHDSSSSSAVTTLSTSSGRRVQVEDAYCSEGEHATHTLSIDGAPVADHSDECTSIAAAEIVDGHLWLGTRADLEYGEYPAEGLLVQELSSGEPIGKLNQPRGLSGNLIRVIRTDPHSGSMWVATHLGIDEVSRNLDILRSWFLFEDFDAETGALRVGVSRSPRPSTPLASFFDSLDVADARAFKDAIESVPREVQESFVEALNSSQYHPQNMLAMEPERAFARPELNALLPFVIAAARSPERSLRYIGLYHLCDFRDPRVVEAVREVEQALPAVSGYRDPHASEREMVKRCLEKLAYFEQLENGR